MDEVKKIKINFEMALDIDVYFSEDAEASWARMKERLLKLVCLNLKF